MLLLSVCERPDVCSGEVNLLVFSAPVDVEVVPQDLDFSM